MKNSIYSLATALLVGAFATSCTENDDPIEVQTSTAIEISGNMSSRTMRASEKYILKGSVFVKAGQVLTIEPGTVIFGDRATKGTLIIERGGRIEANGTAEKPIVFTSASPRNERDRGDWGGLVILGSANVNVPDPAIEGITPAVNYGGTNDADNSGTLNYVRVEYAGIELSVNNETNNITLGGVGSGTTITNCQTSFGGDDGFEWFGGSVNGRNLIAFGMWDDSFDIDFGFSGKLQFLLDVRGSSADQSGSNGIEADSNANDNPTTLPTTAVISNYTSVGPRLTATQAINGNFQHCIDLRRRVAMSLGNSVMIGYPRGMRMNQQSVADNYTAGTGVLINNILVADLLPFAVGSGMTASATTVQNLWNATNTTITTNDFAANFAALGIDPTVNLGSILPEQYASNPNFAVTTGTLTSGAAFTNAKFTTGFQAVTYRGAFGTTDWTDGWAEFRPNAKNY